MPTLPWTLPVRLWDGAPPVLRCTLLYTHFANKSGSAGDSEEEIALIGRCRALPWNVPKGPRMDWYNNTGRTLRPFVGVIGSDGVLRNRLDGPEGMQVWANDPVLNLDSLWYKIVFELIDPNTARTARAAGGFIEVPGEETTLNLTSALRSTPE